MSSDYRAIWRDAHGEPPWPCSDESCDELVHELGIGADKGQVHHRDHDRTNNDIANLELLHHKCHIKHHRAGKPGNRLGATVAPEVRARISASLKGRPAAHGYNEAVRQKISEAHKGKPHVERKYTCECGRVMHAGPLARHQKSTGHTTKDGTTE